MDKTKQDNKFQIPEGGIIYLESPNKFNIRIGDDNYGVTAHFNGNFIEYAYYDDDGGIELILSHQGVDVLKLKFDSNPMNPSNSVYFINCIILDKSIKGVEYHKVFKGLRLLRIK